MCQVSLGRTVANQRDWKTPIKTIAIFRVEGKDQKQKWSLGENTLQSHISFLATLIVNKIKKHKIYVQLGDLWKIIRLQFIA